MTTPTTSHLNRRRLLRSSAALATWLAVGCDRQARDPQSSEKSSPDAKVPLRVTLVGRSDDADVITRAWAAVTDQPLKIKMVSCDRKSLQGITELVMASAGQTDLLIVPLLFVSEAIHRELVEPLSGTEFDDADDSLGSTLPAARNAAARYAGELYGIPLGAAQPFLLSGEEIQPVDSWEAYDRLVEGWNGQAAEPTAPGWAAAMYLWRASGDRAWLFDREDLQPRVDTEHYVLALQQMVQTANRYQSKDQTPQQVWDGVADGKLRGGIGYPDLRSELDETVILHPMPGLTRTSRVLLDPFSPVVLMASSCRQTSLTKTFMNWISGGEGSQALRRQIPGMTETRANAGNLSAAAGSQSSDYDRELADRLSYSVTMPTLQLLGGAEYYQTLDRAVIRAIRQEVSPKEALVDLATQWQEISETIGVKQQIRVWRRSQGMRG